MDNYYRARHLQVSDNQGYKNFDLPSSFERELFHDHLIQLIKGNRITIEKYIFNNESSVSHITIDPAPIIIVEGLFIYHYQEINNQLDFKAMMDLKLSSCFSRRLKRDTTCRNYDETEVRHRYFEHVEPSYHKYIEPFKLDMDLLIDNSESIEDGMKELVSLIQSRLLIAQ